MSCRLPHHPSIYSQSRLYLSNICAPLVLGVIQTPVTKVLMALLLVLYQSTYCTGYDRSYRNFHLYRLHANDVPKLQRLLNQMDRQYQRIDVWSYPSKHSPFADVMVAPTIRHRFTTLLHKRHIHYRLLNKDVQRMIDEVDDENQKRWRRRRNRFRRSDEPRVDIERYNSYENIVRWMRTMASEKPNIVSLFNIGKSFESRDLVGIRIGYKAENKSKIWMDAGIHAREWIAPATAIYAANRIVSETTNNSEVRRLLEEYDVLILPVANPDGYEFSRNHNRMWRKTRSVHPLSRSCPEWSTILYANRNCRGVDGNRNFGFHWGGYGSSKCTPCSNIYAGPKEFSESETRSIRNFLRGMPKLESFISLHSYGQIWLSPWGYSYLKPDNHDQQKIVAEKAIKVVREQSATNYTFGTISDLMYTAAGTSVDYMQNEGVPYIYAIELPPTDQPTNGFLYPPRHIRPTGDGIYHALVELMRVIPKSI